MSSFKEGDKILWRYVHAVNSRTRFQRAKKGVFIRRIKMPLFYREANRRGMGYPIWCLVQFDGNKNPSRVMLRELEPQVSESRE